MGSRPSSLLAAGIVCGVSMRKLIQRALDSRYVSYFRKNRVPAVTDSAPSTDEQIRYFIKRQRDTIWADEPDWDATLDKKIVEGTEFVELDVKITGFPSWEREGKARGNAEWVIPGEFALSQPRHEKRMLFLHGGAFAWGDPKEYRPCTSRLASVTGMPILVIDYRLAPEHLYPAQIEDSVQACLWALENGPFGSGPTTELYVAGDSSGGGTLYSMLINLKENPSTNKHLSRIAGSIAISPWVDLTCSHPSYKSHIWNKETMMGDVQFSYGRIGFFRVFCLFSHWNFCFLPFYLLRQFLLLDENKALHTVSDGQCTFSFPRTPVNTCT
ncbi:hypothetical protein AAMO2058_001046800 [Amorphochlora amoebiformis]